MHVITLSYTPPFAFLAISHDQKSDSQIQPYMTSQKNDHDNGESKQAAGFRPTNQASSVHQNFQQLKIDVRFFWDQSFCIVSDAFSPISTTAINKIKELSILFIQIRLLIFEIATISIQFLKKEIIPATRLRHPRPTGIFHPWSPNFSRSAMKIKIVLPENYSQHLVVYIRNRNVFVFFHIQRVRIFARTLSDLNRSACPTWIADLSFR
jgi:hypothetical protein